MGHCRCAGSFLDFLPSVLALLGECENVNTFFFGPEIWLWILGGIYLPSPPHNSFHERMRLEWWTTLVFALLHFSDSFCFVNSCNNFGINKRFCVTFCSKFWTEFKVFSIQGGTMNCSTYDGFEGLEFNNGRRRRGRN